MQAFYLFCLCLSFRLKVKKRYLLFEKEVRYFQLSSEWYFDVNIVRSSSISRFTKRCFKAQKKVPFFRFQAMSWKAQKSTFFAVGSDVLKSAKNRGSWKWCSQKREKGTFIRSLKKCKLVFSSHGRPFRILLIDRCQPFGAILWIFLSEFTNPLVKR